MVQKVPSMDPHEPMNARPVPRGRVALLLALTIALLPLVAATPAAAQWPCMIFNPCASVEESSSENSLPPLLQPQPRGVADDMSLVDIPGPEGWEPALFAHDWNCEMGHDSQRQRFVCHPQVMIDNPSNDTLFLNGTTPYSYALVAFDDATDDTTVVGGGSVPAHAEGTNWTLTLPPHTLTYLGEAEFWTEGPLEEPFQWDGNFTFALEDRSIFSTINEINATGSCVVSWDFLPDGVGCETSGRGSVNGHLRSPPTMPVAGTPIPPETNSANAPVAAVVVGGTATTVGTVALVAGTEAGRYGIGAPLVSGYYRIRKRHVLDQYTRGRLHGYLVANPGASIAEVRAALRIGNGTTLHHLRMLEREGVVSSLRDGRLRRFYPKEELSPYDQVRTLSLTQSLLLAHVRDHPGIAQKELSATLGASAQVVSYHVQQLQRAGLLEVDREGRASRLHVAPGAAARVRFQPDGSAQVQVGIGSASPVQAAP